MKLFSLKETSETLGVSVAFLRKAVSSGRLKPVRAGRRLLFEESYLLERIKSGELLEPSSRPHGKA